MDIKERATELLKERDQLVARFNEINGALKELELLQNEKQQPPEEDAESN
tara:strand:+ start:330 stop:479 length:150 start_codon:yes stop_codon:yes gene_type:complete